MKINKNTAIVCAIAVIISGCMIVLLSLVIPQFKGYDILQSMVLGVFSSFIVSAVIAIVGYFHERSEILEKTENNIKNLFISMNVLSQIIGNTLQQIYTTPDLSALPFNNISNLSALNIDFLNSMSPGLFCPFRKKGKLYQVYEKLIEFQQIAYNIKNISWSIQVQTLDYSNQMLKLRNNEAFGLQINPIEAQNLDALKNVINIKTAKLHEYVTGQALEMERQIRVFYECSGRRKTWENTKQNLQMEIEDIIRR